MEEEKGVIIVVYKNSRNPRFAGMKRKKNWEGWELPKGHLEEDYKRTVKQEVKEETGISENLIKDIENLNLEIEWVYEDGDEDIRRVYRAYTVKVAGESYIDVSENPHDEHEHGYFFRKSDLEKLLEYENHLEVLEKASEKIKR